MEIKDFLNSKKLFIFDMDGTIYLGGIPFDFAKRFIKIFATVVKRFSFLQTTPLTQLRFIIKSSTASALNRENVR